MSTPTAVSLSGAPARPGPAAEWLLIGALSSVVDILARGDAVGVRVVRYLPYDAGRHLRRLLPGFGIGDGHEIVLGDITELRYLLGDDAVAVLEGLLSGVSTVDL